MKPFVAFAILSGEEQKIILQCMIAICEGPYIDDSEFQTRLGLEREDCRKVMASWPNLDDSIEDSKTTLAINNTLNEVCNGVRIPSEEWFKWFQVPEQSVLNVFSKWSQLRRSQSEESDAGFQAHSW